MASKALSARKTPLPSSSSSSPWSVQGESQESKRGKFLEHGDYDWSYDVDSKFAEARKLAREIEWEDVKAGVGFDCIPDSDDEVDELDRMSEGRRPRPCTRDPRADHSVAEKRLKQDREESEYSQLFALKSILKSSSSKKEDDSVIAAVNKRIKRVTFNLAACKFHVFDKDEQPEEEDGIDDHSAAQKRLKQDREESEYSQLFIVKSILKSSSSKKEDDSVIAAVNKHIKRVTFNLAACKFHVFDKDEQLEEEDGIDLFCNETFDYHADDEDDEFSDDYDSFLEALEDFSD